MSPSSSMRWSLRPPPSVSPVARGRPPHAPTMTVPDPTPNTTIQLVGAFVSCCGMLG
jgi:hypothetical protein